jgi:DNA-binding transcriptional MerR regulator
MLGGMEEHLTVGRLAGLAGITVRTLHHYDEAGLVRPSRRSAAGYRVYNAADAERLRQVLVYRRLGFGLREVAELLGDPSADAVAHLRRQRELLVARREHADALVAAIDKELEARTMGISLTPEEQLEAFGTSQPGGEWADEAEQRWGGTDPYTQSRRRTSAYSKEDWVRIKAEADGNVTAFAAAMRAGLPAASAEAMDAAERHRQHICRNFYECGYPMHQGLADMYLADERFTATYENVAPGLAQYVHDAIHANAARASAS